MMKINRRIGWIIAAVGFVLTVGGAGISFAGWGYGHHSRPDLNSPNYRDMMKQRDEFVQRTADFSRRLNRTQDLLRAELAAKRVNEDKVKELREMSASIMREMEAFEAEHMRTMKELGSDYAEFCRAGGHPGRVHGRNKGMNHGKAHPARK